MGFLVGSQKERARGGGCFRSLIRRKQVDSVHCKPHGHHQLAKELSVPHLIAIGVGSTIGAGIYILVGTVAREHSGPALFISFLIAGIAAALSAFCYAELASRCPSAGSAYHYSYICVGEGVAWLIGWALILEYTIGGSAVARGISPNLALFFGGQDSLPFFLARQHIPGLDVVVDPCAAVLVLVVTGLLCMGIKEASTLTLRHVLSFSFVMQLYLIKVLLFYLVIILISSSNIIVQSTLAQAVVTSINVCAMIFIIIAGSYLGFKTGWAGYELPAGYFPFGVNGMLAGSATVFFAYIGFDSVASTAEEVKNPQRDLPLGIGLALSICCCLYMMVSVVIVGLVPYYAMDPDTPISSAFAAYGMQWAAVRTLLAFTMVAISVLILRYAPPDEVPFPSSLQEIIDSVSLRYSTGCQNVTKEKSGFYAGTSTESNLPLLGKATAIEYPIIVKLQAQGNSDRNEGRRKIAGWTITATCVGAFLLAYAASDLSIPRLLRFIVCGIGGALLLIGLIVLTCIEQDDARHNFGHSGGFICPFVPLLPIVCSLVNIYLLINLGAAIWTRVSVWLIVGVLVYTFYGRTHSSLLDAVYVPATHADEIYRSSGES